jgi:glycine dehydrogenase subunit 1
MANPKVHPYMPNAVPETKAAMMRAIGVDDIDELFEQIPARLRLQGPLELPEPLVEESSLDRHLRETLARNRSCDDVLNFLGAGCWQHYVPAVCDEIAQRSEFLTANFGSASSDHGRFQAYFEFCSQMGELVNMDVVGLPTYSWGCALGNAVRMAARMTGRREVLVPRTISPERLAVLRSFCGPADVDGHIAVHEIGFDAGSGLLDLDELKRAISNETAAVYFENPSYLGFIEEQGKEISRIAHDHGAECVVGVDPISLGVLAAPADYGADIVVGTTQTLGIHMNCGGGSGGFIAARDEERYVSEFPTLLVSIAPTTAGGDDERAFFLTCEHQTSYGLRDEGKDWTGNTVYLWTIVNAVYMSLLGPQGFREIGEVILQRSRYARDTLGGIPGVDVSFAPDGFKEFIANFDGTGKTVRDINRALRERGIYGGKDLSADFPELGQSALYCVTEIHTQGDVDRLADELEEVLAS